MAYSLDELRVRQAGTVAADIPFTLGPNTFHIPTPERWPDAVLLAGKDADVVAMGKALLGDQYEPFIAAGGRSLDLPLILDAYATEQGATLGE
ncbi:hypothetical protein ACFZCK_14195 [Kitasatospora purpeofusca]|uniref:hypothetical protein n=1 Tax=Kitasatospora purpeofusca TaxID=67352 RepID=UPI0036E0AC9E